MHMSFTVYALYKKTAKNGNQQKKVMSLFITNICLESNLLYVLQCHKCRT